MLTPPRQDGRPVLFLDDGGVISDNDLRAPQWQTLVGEYMPPRLGGSAAAWAEANRIAVGALFDEWPEWVRAEPDAGYHTLWTRYQVRWVRDMCAYLGIAGPPSDAECVRLAEEASAWIIPRVRGAYAGAAEAVRALRAAGHALHTASGEHSVELDLYLAAMDVREQFAGLYGPDLVGRPKAGPAFYGAILRHAGVAPPHAVVVDDSERALAWAAEAGAQTVLCGRDGSPTASHTRIGSLAELPALLAG